jgi:chromosome segregation ATPase
MARKTARRPVRSDAGARLSALERNLENCTEEIQRLRRDMDTNIRRIGTMQAEIDHLRAQRSS